MSTTTHDVTEHDRATYGRHAVEVLTRFNGERERERDYLLEKNRACRHFGEIIGDSSALRKTLARVKAVAPTPATVLILGESGVGKELVAGAIHSQSPRAQRSLVKVNCASVPEELFESEFFGHVKGSFTGAHRSRVGYFERADGGTLFLDEVAEIPLALQAKLLRVLQEGQFERVGDEKTREVDVRLVAATNRDLRKAVAEGRFREDLYYRLSVFPIAVPPLRDRRSDIPNLVDHLVRQMSTKLHRELEGVSEQAMATLMDYDWPGNVRELQNVLERAAIMTHGSIIEVPPLQPAAPRSSHGDVDERVLTLEELERAHIERTLVRTRWAVAGHGGAAELLAIHPNTLRSRMKKLGIRRTN